MVALVPSHQAINRVLVYHLLSFTRQKHGRGWTGLSHLGKIPCIVYTSAVERIADRGVFLPITVVFEAASGVDASELCGCYSDFACSTKRPGWHCVALLLRCIIDFQICMHGHRSGPGYCEGASVEIKL